MRPFSVGFSNSRTHSKRWLGSARRERKRTYRGSIPTRFNQSSEMRPNEKGDHAGVACETLECIMRVADYCREIDHIRLVNLEVFYAVFQSVVYGFSQGNGRIDRNSVVYPIGGIIDTSINHLAGYNGLTVPK